MNIVLCSKRSYKLLFVKIQKQIFPENSPTHRYPNNLNEHGITNYEKTFTVVVLRISIVKKRFSPFVVEYTDVSEKAILFLTLFLKTKSIMSQTTFLLRGRNVST